MLQIRLRGRRLDRGDHPVPYARCKDMPARTLHLRPPSRQNAKAGGDCRGITGRRVCDSAINTPILLPRHAGDDAARTEAWPYSATTTRSRPDILAAYKAVSARISNSLRSLPWRGYSATPAEKVQSVMLRSSWQILSWRYFCAMASILVMASALSASRISRQNSSPP